jgi:hypothetical protein
MEDGMMRRAVADETPRETLGSYPTYLEAQRVVDHLSDNRFSVEHVAIVGVDLRLVESVTGRLDNWRATLAGAGGGAWFGLLIGLFLGLFSGSSTSFLAVVLWGVVWGAIAGAVFGLVGYLMTGGTRDFTSRSQLVAGR